MTDQCYMCSAEASTTEHVPPKSFFPEALRYNLWTVPSCADHNLGNSLDVEYVRNVISVQHGTNDAAEQAFEVAKRSWTRSPGLFKRTFKDIRQLTLNGEELGAFPFDLDRLNRVITAVAHGLAYRDFGPRYIGLWRVFCATLRSRSPSPRWDQFRAFLDAATYNDAAVPVPKVFKCGTHTMDQGFIYRLVFYEGVVLYTWPVVAQGGEGGV